jgi:hypothetical protein
MNKVVLDPLLRSRLHDLEAYIELCDESGKVLGYFVPRTEADEALHAWARQEFKEEEIEQARSESGGFSIHEVLAGLKTE